MTFEPPEEPGDDPFTRPVDVKGPKEVKIRPAGSSTGSSGESAPETGAGPFGGSGSDLVCDRDLLYRSLKADETKRREWAAVLGIDPSLKSVREYIASLHPVTLTRDTRVTNHTLTNGVAVPLQSILAAGTTVLVDKSGRPVVRCRCGNPLKPAIFIPTAKCVNCPPNYEPPKQCDYETTRIRHKEIYRKDYYSNKEYDEAFVSSGGGKFRDCYTPYPDPPKVTVITVYEPPPEPEPEPIPQVEPEPVELPPEPAPVPEPEPAPLPPPPPPPTTTTTTIEEPPPEPEPDICNDGLDNEGVPGLIDGDDPNCQ